MDELWGIPMLWVAVGLFFLAIVVYLGGKKIGVSVGAAKATAGFLVIFAIVAMLIAYGVGYPTPARLAGAQYDITMTETEAQTIVDNDGLIWYVNGDFNYTGDGKFANQTATSEVNITLDRTDSGSKADTTRCEVTDVGIVSDDAEGKTHTLISKGTQYNVNWTKAQNPDSATIVTITKRGLSTTLHVEPGGSNWVVVNITFSADAIDALPQYENAYCYLNIGGNTITVIYRVIVVAGGTSPS